MIEKMHEQEDPPSRTSLSDVNEIDGTNEEFRPATTDMFEFKESTYIHLHGFSASENSGFSASEDSCLFNTLKHVCSVANSLLDDYRLSTIKKLPTWAKKQVNVFGIL